MSARTKGAKPRRTTELSQDKLARAIAHPIRRAILDLMEATEEPLSPSKMVGPLGQPIGNVSYHTRILVRLGVLRETKKKQVRGAIEHYYRPTVKIGEIPVEPA